MNIGDVQKEEDKIVLDDNEEVDDDLRWHENKYGNNGKGNSSKENVEIELKYE